MIFDYSEQCSYCANGAVYGKINIEGKLCSARPTMAVFALRRTGIHMLMSLTMVMLPLSSTSLIRPPPKLTQPHVGRF